MSHPTPLERKTWELQGTEQHPQPDNYHLAWNIQLELCELLKAMQIPLEVTMNLMANTASICFQLVDHLNGLTEEARLAADMTGFCIAIEYLYMEDAFYTDFLRCTNINH